MSMTLSAKVSITCAAVSLMSAGVIAALNWQTIATWAAQAGRYLGAMDPDLVTQGLVIGVVVAVAATLCPVLLMLFMRFGLPLVVAGMILFAGSLSRWVDRILGLR